ncbi:hypothetical protein FCK90_10505 [Kocuria coralli]|uniref:Uncharacterized protein n=1 Tax=Kocuria coralli TaxID=1461025 RepID=A0A5J5KY75_9MICC|nr:hypothetical protein [Kocuria coralli]KAA9393835.1 hypothetical protein FCK90_10505 [Kocuria coralli]
MFQLLVFALMAIPVVIFVVISMVFSGLRATAIADTKDPHVSMGGVWLVLGGIFLLFAFLTFA